METTKAKKATPIVDFRDALLYLEQAKDDAARSQKQLGEMTQKAIKSFEIARDAARSTGQDIPYRFMCGQWLVVFSENGELVITEIPNSEPYQLITLAKSMGEIDTQ